MKFLIKKGSNSLNDALIEACDDRSPNYELIQLLIMEGAIPDVIIRNRSVLYNAGKNANVELMKVLIKLGSRDVQMGLFGAVNCIYNQDYFDYTEMDKDSSNKLLQDNHFMIKYFLDRGARIDKNDSYWNHSPCYFACKNNNFENLKLLLEHENSFFDNPYLNKVISAQFEVENPSFEISKNFLEK